MDEYGYLIRTLSNKLYVDFLNYLYAKKDVIVNIDTTVYNIYIKIKNENDFNEISEKTKKFYGDNYVAVKPTPPIQPVFISGIPEVTPTPEVTPDITPTSEVTSTPEVTSNS